ncbi:unnamed protein product (macronuclear) [Paramecium tetraurelia]|uniref:H/ACA ribonucleoprotein complex non-core subunit NAF1 n=1 Tax=Paramecium tetraurelia TaxID=5888 RepID=A0CS26_PARTE|nr:uncharacterized protein GSPATT00009865001 [Paramecium tetraurelia]CAK73593.1 unnamed protein product [Paramecium tetraurelia]|eukprot:XP_001440990.1 hypothetical protein (macronuclear) [Paramecium tetraurelia strain d4-2]
MNDRESSDSSSDEFYEKIKAQLNIMDDEEKSSRIVSRNEVLPKVSFAPPESKEQREINFNYKHSDRIQLIGKIESITKENITIYSNLLEFVINLDQLIVNSQQEILGKVDDVFGKVERPHYSILLDGYVNNLIQTNQLKIGDDVFINVDSTSVLNPDAIQAITQVIYNVIKSKKGCDASNQFDEEVVNEGDIEYSDDEIEAFSKKRGNKEEGEVKKNNKKKEKHHNQQKHDKQQPYPQQNNKVQGNNQQQQQQQQQMMQMQHSMQQQQQYYQQMFLQQQMQLQMQQQQQYQQMMQNQQSFPQQQMQQPQYIQQIYPQPQQLQPNPQLNLPYNPQQINQQLSQNLNSLFQNIKPQDQ